MSGASSWRDLRLAHRLMQPGQDQGDGRVQAAGQQGGIQGRRHRREMQRQRYDNLLPAVHVNGLAGSLLAENLQAQLDATAAKLGKRIVAIGDASGVTAVDAEWAAQRDLDQTQDAAAGRYGY